MSSATDLSRAAGMTARVPRSIVLVDCPDEVGLIHRITGVLQARRLNIEANHGLWIPTPGIFSSGRRWCRPTAP